MALERFLKIRCSNRLGLKNLNSFKPFYLQFTMKVDEKTFFAVLADEVKRPLDPMELVDKGEVPYFNKYDEYVPDSLVRKGFAYGILDIEGMKKRISLWTSSLIESEPVARTGLDSRIGE